MSSPTRTPMVPRCGSGRVTATGTCRGASGRPADSSAPAESPGRRDGSRARSSSGPAAARSVSITAPARSGNSARGPGEQVAGEVVLGYHQRAEVVSAELVEKLIGFESILARMHRERAEDPGIEGVPRDVFE